MDFRIAHDFDVPRATLEEAFISPRLLGALEATARGGGAAIEAITERRRSLEDGVFERVWRVQAALAFLPAFVVDLLRRAEPRGTPGADDETTLASMLGWEEEAVYDLGRHEGRWVVVPSVKPEWRGYVRSTGTYAIEAVGASRSRRVVTGQVDVRAGFVRGIVERLVVAQARRGFEAEATALHDVVHGLSHAGEAGDTTDATKPREQVS